MTLTLDDASRWQHLDAAERLALGQLLRDAFFALAARERRSGAAEAARPSPEAEALRRAVEQVEAEPVGRVDGLAISPFPTARLTAVRFFDAQLLPEGAGALFARPSPQVPLLAGFVDPAALSLRTYENIVPLDRLFEGVTLDLRLSDGAQAAAPEVQRFALQAGAAARDALLRLDDLGLYVPPLNAAARGGARFIFHSALLAESLTQAVRAGVDAARLRGFSHVNPVFRCNRFAPGDEKFHEHRDTPYFDAARGHVSRYTLLLYLTPGSGRPALSVAGAPVLTQVEGFTCVILDQRAPHEGRAFEDSVKVFLRSELIFEDAAVTHDPAIAAAFARACYLTGEGLFTPALARAADPIYERVARAHWEGIASLGTTPEPFLHKSFRGAHFVTNGHDTWFPRQPLSLVECAALTLLDHFNCEVGGVPFRAACTREVVVAPEPGLAWILRLLAAHDAPRAEPLFAALDKEALLPPPEEVDQVCCPFHRQDFEPTRHAEVVDLYERAQAFVRARLLPAPVLMMGEEVFLDPARFVVAGGMIHVLSERALAPVNFAACWNFGGSPGNYLGVEETVTALQPLVPPILYTESADGYHLCFDFFRNGWTVACERQALPVPRILPLNPAEAEESGEEPWLDSVDEALVRPEATPATQRPARSWWSGDSPLMRELDALMPPRRDEE